MEIKIKKKPFKQEDILRELELADRNCQRYFDRMYKILEFTFAAIIAIVSVGFGFYTKDKVDDFVSYLFLYVIPVCTQTTVDFPPLQRESPLESLPQ